MFVQSLKVRELCTSNKTCEIIIEVVDTMIAICRYPLCCNSSLVTRPRVETLSIRVPVSRRRRWHVETWRYGEHNHLHMDQTALSKYVFAGRGHERYKASENAERGEGTTWHSLATAQDNLNSSILRMALSMNHQSMET